MQMFLQEDALKPLTAVWQKAVDAAVACYERGGKLLVCGNGGSAADSEHIVGELMKGFLKKRPLDTDIASKLAPELASRLQMGLPAVSLVSHSALLTAVINDLGAEVMYAQQVMALGVPGDVLIGISTSGNAENVCRAFEVAHAKGMTCIALTGQAESRMSALADIALRAPASATPDVQEYHIRLYHAFCAAVEAHFFDV